MSRELVNYETGVTAPDGYREQANEYVYRCDSCGQQTETSPIGIVDECESCLLKREAAKDMFDALQEIVCQLNGIEGRTYKWIRERAKAAISKAGHDV